jgi:hypothetical protein
MESIVVVGVFGTVVVIFVGTVAFDLRDIVRDRRKRGDVGAGVRVVVAELWRGLWDTAREWLRELQSAHEEQSEAGAVTQASSEVPPDTYLILGTRPSGRRSVLAVGLYAIATRRDVVDLMNEHRWFSQERGTRFARVFFGRGLAAIVNLWSREVLMPVYVNDSAFEVRTSDRRMAAINGKIVQVEEGRSTATHAYCWRLDTRVPCGMVPRGALVVLR